MRAGLLVVARYWQMCAATVVVGALVLGELVLAYQTTRANQATDEAVEADETITNLAVEAQAGVVDMETGYRGFLLTGQDAFLEPYTSGQTTFQSDLRHLEQLTSDPAQVARWQTIGHVVDTWQREVTEPTIARRRALASTPGALGEIGLLVASQNGKQRVDQIRDEFTATIGVTRAQLAQRKQAQVASDARLTSVLVWGTLAVAVLAFGIGAWILRLLDRERLRGIRLAVDTAEHELFNRLTTASGQVQFVQLEAGLSEQQLGRLDAARRSIESAVAVVHEMRELPALRETIWREAAMRTIDFGHFGVI